MKNTCKALIMSCFLKVFGLLFLSVLLNGCGIPVSKHLSENLLKDRQTIFVYPVHILAGSECKFDTVLAKKMVDYINQKGKIKAVFVNMQPDVYNRWHHNEAKMFKNSYYAFQGFINKTMKTGEYALLMQLLMSPDEKYFGAVHTYMVHKNDKKAVSLNLINSHHPFYKEVKPVKRDDGLKIFYKAFDKNFK